ncbi:uncharacterized protein B0P05DRAFT_552188 [Gilbertella persicaria]|uniref:uncharacterized protein n=1 Tax=Gilbertella persicaria TaxID=101096 RepID=UPI0022212A0A|nr:uncharacterized protein B0P05DRAFT_552188 [Gilbertella persicaria]KAI8068183.1 hypothetical protein B0P05DRAFT_552188 [Gilbertella persicaria]
MFQVMNNRNQQLIEIDCSQYTTCSSCIAQSACGFCRDPLRCTNTGWTGNDVCGLDAYYQQCHVSLFSMDIMACLLILVLLVMSYMVYARSRSHDTQEDEPLLNDRFLRRTSTYYQWNQPPLQPQQFNPTHWETRKKALLKKYERPQ